MKVQPCDQFDLNKLFNGVKHDDQQLLSYSQLVKQVDMGGYSVRTARWHCSCLGHIRTK